METKIHPVVEKYFNLVSKNLPYGCKMTFHSDIDSNDGGIVIYHTHGSFTVNKSELIRIWREDKIDSILKNLE